PSAHPQYVGMLGMHGNYGPNLLTAEADLLIAIGMRFDDRVTGNVATYAKQAKIIHVDIDAAELNKNVHCTLTIRADARETLRALLPCVEERRLHQWHSRCKECREIEDRQVIQHDLYPAAPAIRMGEVVRVLCERSE